MIKFIYEKSINDDIVRAMTKQVETRIRQNTDKIKDYISSHIRRVFTETEEYRSLTSGQLMGHFGLNKAEAPQIVDKIIKTLGEQIEITYNKGITIYAVKSNFEELLLLDEASYESDPYHIPWLDWFLMQGDRIVVTDYHITWHIAKQDKFRSRSGLALMSRGGVWGGSDWKKAISLSYAGTPNDNWITDVCENFQKAFVIVVKKALEQVLNV